MYVLDVLKEHNIDYELFEHPPVNTVEEAKQWSSSIKGVHCKNLFLRNRSGKAHYLIVLEQDQMVDLKVLSENMTTTNLSFASEKRLKEYLALEPGSVSPFGLINDQSRLVHVYFDEKIIKEEYAAFHPNVNTHTVVVKVKDLLCLLQHFGYEIMMIRTEASWQVEKY